MLQWETYESANIQPAKVACRLPVVLAVCQFSWFGCAGASDPNSSPVAAESHNLATPAPDLLPETVVRLQLRALRANRPDGEGIRQCFQFASPANRKITGSLTQFAAMLESPPFDCLFHQRATLVGKPMVAGERAHVMATFVDQHNRIRLFLFELSRQSGMRFDGCWMTDSVVDMNGVVDIDGVMDTNETGDSPDAGKTRRSSDAFETSERSVWMPAMLSTRTESQGK